MTVGNFKQFVVGSCMEALRILSLKPFAYFCIIRVILLMKFLYVTNMLQMINI